MKEQRLCDDGTFEDSFNIVADIWESNEETKEESRRGRFKVFHFLFSIAIQIESARLNVVHGGVDLEINDNSDDSSESTLSSTPCPASSSSDKYSLLLLYNSNWNDEDSNSIRKMMIKSHILNG